MSKSANRDIPDWAAAERAMAELAQVEASRRKLQAQLDKRIADMRAEFQIGLQEREAQAEYLEKQLTKFAKGHKREFKPREEGGDTRSFEHAGVAIGFRTTPPQVRIENEEKAIDWLSQNFGGTFVRTKAEPDRQALADVLKDDTDPLTEKFAKHGITLQQRDKFFCEVKG